MNALRTSVAARHLRIPLAAQPLGQGRGRPQCLVPRLLASEAARLQVTHPQPCRCQLRLGGGGRWRSGVPRAAGDADASVAVEQLPPTEAAPPPAAEAAEGAAGDAEAADVDGLDIRVGKILKAWKHPEADSLYVEEVDVGEEAGPRTICSGLVKYVPEEELQDRFVVVLANLKPRNMRGVKSNGMLLATSDAGKERVELLSPPDGAAPGDRVWFGDEEGGASQGAALTPNQVAKKKVWEAIQPQLRCSAEGTAMFGDRPMRVGAGPITSKTIMGGTIS